MKKHILLPLLTLAAGGAGFYLNYKLQTESVNPLTQLLVADTPYPALLLSLTLGFSALLFLLLCHGTAPVGLAKVYANPPTATVALWMAGGLLLLLGGGTVVPEFLSAVALLRGGFSASLPTLPLISAVLALPACVGLLVLCKYLSRGKYTNTLPIMTLFPALSALPWLLYCYYENNKNPVHELFGYQMVGVACAVLGLYLVSSLAYLPESGRPKTAVFFSLLGVYLLITSLSLGQEFYTSASHQALALILLGNAIVLLKNIQYPHPASDESQALDKQEGTD